MGMINVSVDTDKKSMAVSVDGKAVKNVREVYAYQGFNSKGEADGYSMSVTTVDSSSDVRKVTTYVASGSKEAEAAAQAGLITDRETIPGFVGFTDKTQVQKEIAEFFDN
jgi:hypothetical protein